MPRIATKVEIQQQGMMRIPSPATERNHKWDFLIKSKRA